MSRKAVSKKSNARAKVTRAKSKRIARGGSKSNRQVKDKGLSSAEYQQLIIDHRDNGRKLARSMLRKWHVRMPAEEIDSIVDLTLCEAASRFSKKFGASFMTFLFYHLRGQLVRAVSAAANSNNFLVTFAQNSEMDTGDWGCSQQDFIRSQLSDDLDFVPREVENPESSLLAKETKEICEQACKHLDELELLVIQRSYEKEESLVDIAKSLGYSRCHISRVKKRALDKLKEVIDFDRAPKTSTKLEKATPSLIRPAETLRVVKRRSRRRRALSESDNTAESTRCAA
jgi:RNA polymerase sigma factor (sigma-70 family)